MRGGGGNATSHESSNEFSSSASSSDESLESDNSCDTTTSDEVDDSTTTSCSSANSRNDDRSEQNQHFVSPLLIKAVIGESHKNGDRDCQRCYRNADKDSDEGDFYSSSVKEWTARVPIGINLCPWAKLSHKEGTIKYVTCQEDIQLPQEASEVVWKEIEKLRHEGLPAWSTTLVICPNVKAWKSDYVAFETFVKNFGKEEAHGSDIDPIQAEGYGGAITLVPFHPQFLRWRGLPETIQRGSNVRCHKGLAGFSKSQVAHPATVIDLLPKGFGRRRIKVRFEDDDETYTRKATEQCVPLDWVVLSESDSDNDRPPLPDNLMHRAPYPVIHILRNEDLRDLSIREISCLKRRNAKRFVSETLT